MNVIGRECNHTSVSGDTTEESESVRERVRASSDARVGHNVGELQTFAKVAGVATTGGV